MKQAEKIRTLRQGEGTAHFNMLNLCYDPWGAEDEWKRRYVSHPDFNITENVVVVEENGQWAGGGTGWFREALLKNNRRIMIYGAGDLYVHPDHRGKGIYSTAMRGLNQLAQKKGAALGFAYPSIYRLPAMALPKYGFVETFYPTTHVLVLNPEKFFRFLVSRAKKAFFSEKFNGIRLKLTVSFDTPRGKRRISEEFLVENGQIKELQATPEKKHLDLSAETEASVLLRLVSGHYLGKRGLVLFVLSNIVKRRLKVRFSMRFLKSFLGV
jgi:GNAT superfamily N-acetyltransferase